MWHLVRGFRRRAQTAFSGDQLPAGGVDISPPVRPDCGVDAVPAQPIPKSGYAGRRRTTASIASGRVERDDVDVGGQWQRQFSQFGGVPGCVVYTVDQGPLEREPAALGGQVLGARPHKH